MSNSHSTQTSAAPVPAPPPVSSQEQVTQDTKPAAPAASGDEINSPMVGTFYRSASPDTDAYVEIGTVVKKGQVLCIIEAMKLMNEIESSPKGDAVFKVSEA